MQFDAVDFFIGGEILYWVFGNLNDIVRELSCYNYPEIFQKLIKSFVFLGYFYIS